MAWQTPKTDWTGSDGVRNTDLNRIEGNILHLYNTSMVSADMNIFVDPTGSDSTGNGSSTSPYASITAALNSIPKNLSGRTVTIDIGAGQYDENVVIRGFSGTINLYSSGVVRIQSLTVENSVVYQYGTQTNFPGGIRLNHDAAYIGQSLTYVSAAGSIGVSVLNGSTFILYNTLSISNTTSAAIEVSGGSRFYASTVAGTSNTLGIRADTGGMASYGAINITATTRHITNTGGRVYTGAQTNAPNY